MGLKNKVKIGRSLYLFTGTVDDVADFDPENLVREPVFVDFGIATAAGVPASFLWDWTNDAIEGYSLVDGSGVTESAYNEEIPYVVIGTN